MDVSTPGYPSSFKGSGSGSGSDAFGGNQTGKRAGRRDGRTAAAMRKLTVIQGVFSRADGSARVKMGNTDAIVNIYGPMDCPVHRQLADRSDIHVSFRQAGGSLSSISNMHGHEASFEHILARDVREIVTNCVMTILHPRKAIAVAVLLLSNDGGTLSAIVNATFVALLDAGVPMRSVFSACSVSICNESIVVDPDKAEEAEANATITVVHSNAYDLTSDIIAIHTHGDCCGGDIFDSALSCAKELSASTLAFMQLAIEGKLSIGR